MNRIRKTAVENLYEKIMKLPKRKPVFSDLANNNILNTLSSQQVCRSSTL